MQKPRPALVRVTAPIVMTAVMLLSVRSAHAEVTLGEPMRKCLLLENYWALKSTEDTTSSIPNDGSAVCFSYLLAFRGLQRSSGRIAHLLRAVVGPYGFV
jgi:hypothetical protein